MHTKSVQSIFWSHSKLLNVVTVICASIIIAISAQITIPLMPVPVTLQNFAIFAIAIALGSRLATAAVVLYLIEGFSGLPVFAPVASLTLSSGYLIGMLIAAWVIGRLLETGACKNRLQIAAIIMLGNVIVFTIGATVLASFIGFAKAWQFGVEPFYLVCLVKLLVLTAIAPYFWKNQ